MKARLRRFGAMWVVSGCLTVWAGLFYFLGSIATI